MRRIALALFLGIGLVSAQGSPTGQTQTDSRDPSAADIERGIQLFRAKDPAAAKLRFGAAIRENPHSADAFTWRGIAENQLKQYTEAVRDFQSALTIDGGEMSAHYNLALTYIRLGQVDNAIAQLQIVVRAHPGVVEPEYNLAVLFEDKKATSEAVEHLQAAYRTQPEDIGVTQHLLLDLLALGRTNEAQPMLESLRNDAPPEMLKEIGVALLEAKQFPQAVLLLDSARAKRGTGREVDLLLARAYIGAQDFARAIDLLKPLESGDTSGEAAYLLGLAYIGANQLPEAKEAFWRSVQANPHDPGALYHLGLIESSIAEQQTSGLRHLQEAARLEPDNTAYALALGRALLQLDKPEEALIPLRRPHIEGHEAGERDLLLSIAEIDVKGANQAIPTLERSIAEDPSVPLAYNLLGFCYFGQGDYAKAADYYRKASDLLPDNLVFAHDAAIAFDRTGDEEQAAVYAARAVALPSSSGEDHYLVGKLLAKAGRTEDAMRELKIAVALSPELDSSYYLLARSAMRIGDTTQAVEWNTKLAELKQKHDRDYTQQKATQKKDKPVPSSTLLHGAPMTSAETDAQ